MNTQRLIKISKNQIFLTPDMFLNLSDTSLKGADIRFGERQDIYWAVAIVEHDRRSRIVELCVIDYFPTNTENFNTQVANWKVSFIRFLPLIWGRIDSLLTIHAKNRLICEGIVVDDGKPYVKSIDELPPLEAHKITHGGIPPLTNSLVNIVHLNKFWKPVIRKITEEAKVYFKDAEFKLGFVAIKYKSKEFNRTFNLTIANSFILPEFNAVKSYFPKVLGTGKQFSINIIFTLTDNVVTDTLTTSLEIDTIDDSVIDRIRHERVAHLTSTPVNSSPDKSLYTAEDIFDNFDEVSKEGNVFLQSETEILHSLIKTKNVRNATHLQYLSGKMQSAKHKLRFTLKPLFGFLFFIEGPTKNHFCWELLNSHATYLWSFEKADVEIQFKEIEEIINSIRTIGRDEYKRSFKSNTTKKELVFCSIDHSNINSLSGDGFTEWRDRLIKEL